MKDYRKLKPGESMPLSAYADAPSSGGRIPFDERDLVSVPEIQKVSVVGNYGDVISKGAQGAAQALEQQNRLAAQKMDLKEQKRRRIADLLARALKRDSSFAQLGTEHGDDAIDYQTQGIQDVARGFADTFRGSRRG